MRPGKATAGSVAFGVALAAILALGAWLRVTSLETMHFPDADEAWYGVEALKLARGEPMATRTTAGNLIDPYFVVAEAALLTVVEPSLWVLRAPAAAGGLLAVALMYGLMRTRLDRPTALIAASTLAVLPIAVIFSRVGYYASLTPLFGVLTLAFALRGSRLGVLGMTVAGYLLHPTTVFLLPVPAAVLLSRTLRDTEGDPARRRRALLGLSAGGAAIVLAAGVLVSRVPHMRATVDAAGEGGSGSLSYFLHQDRYGPIEFLRQFDRFLLGVGTAMFPIPEATLRAIDLAFWAAVGPVGVLGLAALVRRRQWERAALVLGTAAAAVGYGVVAGRQAFRPTYLYDQRYAMVLVAPTALALACLVRPLLVEPTGRARSAVRWGQQAALLGAAALLLLTVKASWFDRYTSLGGESLWTLRTDAKDPNLQVVSIIGRDLDRRRRLDPADAPASGEVLTSDHWTDQQIRFLAGRRPDLGVTCLGLPADAGPGDRDRIRERLLAGSYVAAGPGQPIDRLVTSSFAPDELVRWDAVGLAGDPSIAVYRLRRPADAGPIAVQPPDSRARR